MTTAELVADVCGGLAAGWVGARVKAGSEGFLQDWAERVVPPGPGQKELPGADPAGHADRMPPALLYRRLVALADRRRGSDRELSPEQVEAGAVWLHRLMAYGYPVVYAGTTRRVPKAQTGQGLLGGLALFGAFHGGVLPALGVQAQVSTLPRAWWLWEGGSHLAYGVAVHLVVRGMRLVTG